MEHYRSLVNNVQDYIDTHLDEPLVLEQLSSEFGFSPFHFHRIYRVVTDETVYACVLRVRLERCLALLALHPDMKVIDIAVAYHFSDAAVFSRAFKRQYGVTPSEYRKNRKVFDQETTHTRPMHKGGIEFMEYTLVTKRLDHVKMMYQRYTGSYEGFAEVYPQMRQALFDNVQAGNLWNMEQLMIFTGYNDNPGFTQDGNLRTSVGMSINDSDYDFEAHNMSVGYLDGAYAVFEYETTFEFVGEAWNQSYKVLINSDAYTIRDALPLEVYVSDPRENPKGVQRFDIYIPIES